LQILSALKIVSSGTKGDALESIQRSPSCLTKICGIPSLHDDYSSPLHRLSSKLGANTPLIISAGKRVVDSSTRDTCLFDSSQTRMIRFSLLLELFAIYEGQWTRLRFTRTDVEPNFHESIVLTSPKKIQGERK